MIALAKDPQEPPHALSVDRKIRKLCASEGNAVATKTSGRGTTVARRQTPIFVRPNFQYDPYQTLLAVYVMHCFSHSLSVDPAPWSCNSCMGTASREVARLEGRRICSLQTTVVPMRASLSSEPGFVRINSTSPQRRLPSFGNFGETRNSGSTGTTSTAFREHPVGRGIAHGR